MSNKNKELNPSEFLEKGVFSIEMLSPCGIYCGLCAQILKDNKKCHGCNSNKGFAKTERKMCGIYKCCKKQGISRCNECEIFPDCDRLQKFTKWDSFVTHAACIENLNEFSNQGEEKFIENLKNKVKNGEFPPLAQKGGIKLRNIWPMMKPPYKPKKNKK
ncbi:MAG: DUF3795 domain-containing protein [archaeon]|nr:DUF3795 domain-containing protein [archaeon]